MHLASLEEWLSGTLALDAEDRLWVCGPGESPFLMKNLRMKKALLSGCLLRSAPLNVAGHRKVDNGAVQRDALF
jgi:hypothetical protein